MRLLRRSVAAALALFLLAGVASGQDGDLGRKYVKDRKLGTGTFKSAWTLKDAKTGKPIPDKVLILVDRTTAWEDIGDAEIKTMLADEQAQLEQLDKAGVPAAKYLAIGTYQGKQAGIQPRFTASNRDWMTWNGDDAVEDASDINTKAGLARWDLLNERSIAAIDAIRAGMAKGKLYVRDPQVLIAANGDVVVADPMEVKTKAETTYSDLFKQRMDTVLSVLENEARAAVLARKIEKLKGLPDSDARGLATWYENGPDRFRGLILRELAAGDDEVKKIAKAFEDGTIKMDFLGTLEAGAKDVVHLTVGDSWHRLVFDAVRKGGESLVALEKGRVTLDAKVESAVRALLFSKATQGDALDRSVPRGPKTIADLVLDERGRPATDADRAKAEATAKALLARDRGGEPRGVGLSGVLERRVAAERAGEADRDR
jgi:hypothetical protein